MRKIDLRYICEMEFAGRAAALHEYLIGVEAMGRPMAYSPEEVYARELTDASVRIDVRPPRSSRRRGHALANRRG